MPQLLVVEWLRLGVGREPRHSRCLLLLKKRKKGKPLLWKPRWAKRRVKQERCPNVLRSRKYRKGTWGSTGNLNQSDFLRNAGFISSVNMLRTHTHTHTNHFNHPEITFSGPNSPSCDTVASTPRRSCYFKCRRTDLSPLKSDRWPFPNLPKHLIFTTWQAQFDRDNLLGRSCFGQSL